jgi:hypothetical protein
MKKLLLFAALATAIVVFAQQVPTPQNSIALAPPSDRQVGQAFEHQILILDGMKCTGCSFKNLSLLYSGGTYDLTDATFSGTIAVELHGAAQNGASILTTLTSSKPEFRTRLTFDTPKTLSLKNTW